jgi:hypothetical protein
MKRAAIIILLLLASALTIGQLVRASQSSSAQHATHRAAPIIRSSGQLAAVIRRHDTQRGGAGPFEPQVTVTCRPADPTGTGAYDHICRETYLGALCTVGSTPEVYVLMIDVLRRGYSTVRQRTAVNGACSPP